MKYDPEKHHRRSIRLQGYDYSQPGAYFITVVTQDRVCLFGEVVNGEMRLNDVGHMVRQEWADLPNRFPNIDLDAFIIMPNHIHGIIIITDVNPVGAGLVPAQEGATTRVAPTDAPKGATVGGGPVGAGLVPAQEGATTRVAPTDAPEGATVGGGPVGAGLVPAQEGATTRVAPTDAPKGATVGGGPVGAGLVP
ncbi:MAG: hypothetical protein H5T63_01625, partial [Chloroflexi bacterium]|nr:hypothetical protein [Chloroflexota bacterium]